MSDEVFGPVEMTVPKGGWKLVTYTVTYDLPNRSKRPLGTDERKQASQESVLRETEALR